MSITLWFVFGWLTVMLIGLGWATWRWKKLVARQSALIDELLRQNRESIGLIRYYREAIHEVIDKPKEGLRVVH